MSDPLEGGIPHAVALSWGMAANPQRGPKREMSVERIVETAMALADEGGLPAVSMSKVAAALGFTTMALYRYVTSKDDLLLLMQDAACGAMLMPPFDPAVGWRQGLREFALGSAAMLREHPWFMDIPISGVPMTPNNLAIVDWGLGYLSGLALTNQEKMSIVLLLSTYAREVGVVERDMSRAQAEAGAGRDVPNAADVLKTLVEEVRFPHLFPVLHAGAYTDQDPPGQEHDDFGFGLERILDGIEHYLGVRGEAELVPEPAADARTYPKDKAVREAVKARREVESKLREALKREREMVKKALEREAQARQ
jgi:AcrR family transcriptional regulator